MHKENIDIEIEDIEDDRISLQIANIIEVKRPEFFQRTEDNIFDYVEVPMVMAAKVTQEKIQKMAQYYQDIFYYIDNGVYYVYRNDENFDDPVFGEDMENDISEMYLNQSADHN